MPYSSPLEAELEYEIDFQNALPSPAVETEIVAQVRRLERLFPHILACKVLVSRQQTKGYQAQIQLTVPRRGLEDFSRGPL